MTEPIQKPPTSSLPDGEAQLPAARSSTLSDRVKSLRLPDWKEPAPKRTSWLPWVLCVVLAGTTLGLGALVFLHSMAEPDKPVLINPAPTSTSDQVAVASSGDVVLESKGNIIPAHQIQVSPKVGGMVVELHILEGKRVKKGEVLARLETIDYGADRDRAEAALENARQHLLELERGNRPEEVEGARAELGEMEAQRDQLYLDWKRSDELKTSSAVPIRDLEQAYASYKAMDHRVERLRQALKIMSDGPRQERVAGARAEVGQAQADLVKAEWRLENCTIRAPISGTILTKKAEEGNIVNPIAFNISASLCDMADLSDLEVDLNIQERDIAKVFKGQHCKIRPEAFKDRIYEGTVSRLMPIADRSKGAIPVRVKVDVPSAEEGVYLKPEMGVIVSFLKPEPAEAR